jgi:primosomal protein N' (replication factor Y)
MGQLITQVAGRAGRSDTKSEVALQTQHPEHPLLQILIHHGYDHFAEVLLPEREQCALPPYTYLALFTAEAKHPELPKTHLDLIRAQLIPLLSKTTCTLYGPLPASPARK